MAFVGPLGEFSNGIATRLRVQPQAQENVIVTVENRFHRMLQNRIG